MKNGPTYSPGEQIWVAITVMFITAGILITML